MIYDHVVRKSKTRKFERLWMYRPGKQEIYIPPLIITIAGYGCWSSGNEQSRSNSQVFGIELVCAGNAEFVQDDRRYIIQKGEVYLLRRNVSHCYKTGPADILLKRFITIDGSTLNYLLRIMNLWGRDRIRLSNPNILAVLLKKATSLIAENPPDVDIKCSVLAYRILLELSHSLRPDLPAVIDNALTYMQQNLHRHLSTENLCGYLGISQTHFNRLFSQYMQSSPMRYFLQQKLTWAGHMLRHTSLSIKEIADRTGYSDPLYFSARFKKQFGISPGNYRKFGVVNGKLDSYTKGKQKFCRSDKEKSFGLK